MPKQVCEMSLFRNKKLIKKYDLKIKKMNTYLLFKSIHLIAVISWMAGLLYLPRIFVYHAEKINEQNISETFKIMERRLMNFIMIPAMIISWIFGILLILVNADLIHGSLYLSIKLILVILLTTYHFFLMTCVWNFEKNQNSYSAKFYRFINEIPTILLIAIVFVIIFKPL